MRHFAKIERNLILRNGDFEKRRFRENFKEIERNYQENFKETLFKLCRNFKMITRNFWKIGKSNRNSENISQKSVRDRCVNLYESRKFEEKFENITRNFRESFTEIR